MRRIPHRVFDSDGFSLIEVAMALLVIAVGIMGVFALFPAGINASIDAVDDSRLSLLAAGVLADLREHMATNYSDNAAGFQYDFHGIVIEPKADLMLSSADPLFDELGINQLCRLVLHVEPIHSMSLVEARVRVWPGRYDNRHLDFYTRFANRQ